MQNPTAWGPSLPYTPIGSTAQTSTVPGVGGREPLPLTSKWQEGLRCPASWAAWPSNPLPKRIGAERDPQKSCPSHHECLHALPWGWSPALCSNSPSHASKEQGKTPGWRPPTPDRHKTTERQGEIPDVLTKQKSENKPSMQRNDFAVKYRPWVKSRSFLPLVTRLQIERENT